MYKTYKQDSLTTLEIIKQTKSTVTLRINGERTLRKPIETQYSFLLQRSRQVISFAGEIIPLSHFR